MFVVMWENLIDFLLQVIYLTVSVIITGNKNEWRIYYLFLSMCKLRSKKESKQVNSLSEWTQLLLNIRICVFNWAAPYFCLKYVIFRHNYKILYRDIRYIIKKTVALCMESIFVRPSIHLSVLLYGT